MNNIDEIDDKLILYKCKKCRIDLFSSNQIVTHKKETTNADEICAQELYVESLSWFANKIEEIKGKIRCYKCESKLGSYDWCGSICSCGAWVTPAFHIASNKVDIYKSLNNQ